MSWEDVPETLVPLVVPTLNKPELEYLLRIANGGKKDPDMDRIVDSKARKSAYDRIKQGKSPFIEPGESTYPLPSK